MNVYFDTSALIKFYIQENHSDIVSNLINSASAVATHEITWIEIHAALARLTRENRLNAIENAELKNAILQDWESFLRIKTDEKILLKAAQFAEAFALRAYDSLHLAAADNFAKSSNVPRTFACFDQKLNQAATVLGMNLLA
jgi:uncharacterized protein